MSDPYLPDSPYERAIMMQTLLIDRATGGGAASDDLVYQQLRRQFVDDLATRDRLPQFVRTCRDLGSFWGWIKGQSGQWEPRRALIRLGFTDLLDYLEKGTGPPSDGLASGALEAFDPEAVHRAWARALDRRERDPEGAITAARTLLEEVCKAILDRRGLTYADKDDLPKLYREAAGTLSLAPSDHTEPVFRSILGSCQNVVGGLGELRNKVGDAHGQGRRQVRPAARHAALAVNLAGSLATFLVETYAARVGR